MTAATNRVQIVVHYATLELSVPNCAQISNAKHIKQECVSAQFTARTQLNSSGNLFPKKRSLLIRAQFLKIC